ncbi:hypothetical protein C8R46DRAFT_925140 [Mycena filopes]|nr:hypothetical protein C8R46DRAFT_925140 [Mycena filopes]
MAAAGPFQPRLPPIAPLHWTYYPHSMPEHVKILAIVQILKDMKLSPMDLVTSLLVDPTHYQANIDGFYRSSGLEQLLNVVSKDKHGARKLFAWFERPGMDRLLRDIHSEMDQLSLAFRRSSKDITPEDLIQFDFDEHITDVCRDTTPILRHILTAACQTPRAARENTLKDVEPIAKTRSENNNLCAIPCSLYFLASGMPRKVIDTLAHAGMNLSYNSVQKTHSTLATGQLRRAQTAARSGHAVSWDNTHISLSIHVEQRTLVPPKVQTGTTQLIYILRGLTDMATLKLSPILQRRLNADLITFANDIRPTRAQCASIQEHLRLTIVQLLIENTKGFEYLKDSPDLRHKAYRPPPSDHHTTEHVLRTTKIDEGSTEGTTQVNDNIYLDQLKYDIHDLDDTAVPSYNDQKTNALIRSAQLLRMGDLSALLRLEHYQLARAPFTSN